MFYKDQVTVTADLPSSSQTPSASSITRRPSSSNKLLEVGKNSERDDSCIKSDANNSHNSNKLTDLDNDLVEKDGFLKVVSKKKRKRILKSKLNLSVDIAPDENIDTSINVSEEKIQENKNVIEESSKSKESSANTTTQSLSPESNLTKERKFDNNHGSDLNIKQTKSNDKKYENAHTGAISKSYESNTNLTPEAVKQHSPTKKKSKRKKKKNKSTSNTNIVSDNVQLTDNLYENLENKILSDNFELKSNEYFIKQSSDDLKQFGFSYKHALVHDIDLNPKSTIEQPKLNISTQKSALDLPKKISFKDTEIKSSNLVVENLPKEHRKSNKSQIINKENKHDKNVHISRLNTEDINYKEHVDIKLENLNNNGAYEKQIRSITATSSNKNVEEIKPYINKRYRTKIFKKSNFSDKCSSFSDLSSFNDKSTYKRTKANSNSYAETLLGSPKKVIKEDRKLSLTEKEYNEIRKLDSYQIDDHSIDNEKKIRSNKKPIKKKQTSIQGEQIENRKHTCNILPKELPESSQNNDNLQHKGIIEEKECQKSKKKSKSRKRKSNKDQKKQPIYNEYTSIWDLPSTNEQKKNISGEFENKNSESFLENQIENNNEKKNINLTSNLEQYSTANFPNTEYNVNYKINYNDKFRESSSKTCPENILNVSATTTTTDSTHVPSQQIPGKHNKRHQLKKSNSSSAFILNNKSEIKPKSKKKLRRSISWSSGTRSAKAVKSPMIMKLDNIREDKYIRSSIPTKPLFVYENQNSNEFCPDVITLKIVGLSQLNNSSKVIENNTSQDINTREQQININTGRRIPKRSFLNINPEGNSINCDMSIHMRNDIDKYHHSSPINSSYEYMKINEETKLPQNLLYPSCAFSAGTNHDLNTKYDGQYSNNQRREHQKTHSPPMPNEYGHDLSNQQVSAAVESASSQIPLQWCQELAQVQIPSHRVHNSYPFVSDIKCNAKENYIKIDELNNGKPNVISKIEHNESRLRNKNIEREGYFKDTEEQWKFKNLDPKEKSDCRNFSYRESDYNNFYETFKYRLSDRNNQAIKYNQFDIDLIPNRYRCYSNYSDSEIYLNTNNSTHFMPYDRHFLGHSLHNSEYYNPNISYDWQSPIHFNKRFSDNDYYYMRKHGVNYPVREYPYSYNQDSYSTKSLMPHTGWNNDSMKNCSSQFYKSIDIRKKEYESMVSNSSIDNRYSPFSQNQHLESKGSEIDDTSYLTHLENNACYSNSHKIMHNQSCDAEKVDKCSKCSCNGRSISSSNGHISQASNSDGVEDYIFAGWKPRNEIKQVPCFWTYETTKNSTQFGYQKSPEERNEFNMEAQAIDVIEKKDSQNMSDYCQGISTPAEINITKNNCNVIVTVSLASSPTTPEDFSVRSKCHNENSKTNSMNDSDEHSILNDTIESPTGNEKDLDPQEVIMEAFSWVDSECSSTAGDIDEDNEQSDEEVDEESLLTGKFKNICKYSERVRKLRNDDDTSALLAKCHEFIDDDTSDDEKESEEANVRVIQKKAFRKNITTEDIVSHLSQLHLLQAECIDTEKCSLSEGELERQEELKQRFKRSSSLKCGKTPPGTPGRKKIVRFADVLGLDLAAVRTFLDGIPNVPQSAFTDLEIEEALSNVTSNSSNNSSPITQKYPISGGIQKRVLTPLFQQPGEGIGFLDQVLSNRVMLENVKIGDDFSVKGIIRVMNLDFEKKVVIRYTFDQWKNYHETTATYIDGSSDGFSDKFSFLLWGSFLQDGGALAFCIRYQTKGQEFWDNNKGFNYVLQSYTTFQSIVDNNTDNKTSKTNFSRPQNAAGIEQQREKQNDVQKSAESGGGSFRICNSFDPYVSTPTTPTNPLDPWVNSFF